MRTAVAFAVACLRCNVGQRKHKPITQTIQNVRKLAQPHMRSAGARAQFYKHMLGLVRLCVYCVRHIKVAMAYYYIVVLYNIVAPPQIESTHSLPLLYWLRAQAVHLIASQRDIYPHEAHISNSSSSSSLGRTRGCKRISAFWRFKQPTDQLSAVYTVVYAVSLYWQN